MNRYLALSSLATGLFLVAATTLSAAQINPSDMRGLRDFSGTGGSALLLGFSGVNGATEDRTIAHFDIATVGAFTSASLTLGTQNQDSFAGTLEVYSFAGDGTVSTDEWAAGTLLTTLTGIAPSVDSTTFDITALLTSAVGAGDNYLSFRLSNPAGAGRYFLQNTIGGVTGATGSEGPSFITTVAAPPAVPLPAGAVLLVSGLGLLALRRQRSD